MEKLSKLKSGRFLLVGRLVIAKHFHKEALFGTMKNIRRTQEDVIAVPLNAPERFSFSFKSDLDRRIVLRSSPWTFVPDSGNGRNIEQLPWIFCHGGSRIDWGLFGQFLAHQGRVEDIRALETLCYALLST